MLYYYQTIEKPDEEAFEEAFYKIKSNVAPIENLAKHIARNYYEYHAGWGEVEYGPLKIIIFDNNKNEIGRFTIDVEFNPSFWVEKIGG